MGSSWGRKGGRATSKILGCETGPHETHQRAVVLRLVAAGEPLASVTSDLGLGDEQPQPA